jgi:hypothetical protein
MPRHPRPVPCGVRGRSLRSRGAPSPGRRPRRTAAPRQPPRPRGPRTEPRGACTPPARRSRTVGGRRVPPGGVDRVNPGPAGPPRWRRRPRPPPPPVGAPWSWSPTAGTWTCWTPRCAPASARPGTSACPPTPARPSGTGAFLAAARGQTRIVLGTRRRPSPPWPTGPGGDLGRRDPLHAEPRAPYPHAREVRRCAPTRSARFWPRWSRTVEATLLLRGGLGPEITVSREHRRGHWPG